ncbi:hypothetical protein OAO87_01565 [bacterium]|nr:hypothetical protein [bacterium]
MHLETLETWLLDQDPGFETILKFGWALNRFLDRQLIFCFTNLHISSLKDEKAPIPEGTFKKPFLVSEEYQFTLILAAKEITMTADEAKPYIRGAACHRQNSGRAHAQNHPLDNRRLVLCLHTDLTRPRCHRRPGRAHPRSHFRTS